MFTLLSILLTLTALASYLNVRFFRLPSGVFFLAQGAVAGAGVLVAGRYSPVFAADVKRAVGQLDFANFLMDHVLGFLLFAGALHVRAAALRRAARGVTLFATLGTALTTALVGGLAYGLLHLAGTAVPLLPCLLLGAVLAPTDPVAVMGIMKANHLDANIETHLVGESLFNDGVGVVFFTVLLTLAAPGGAAPTAGGAALLLLREAGGGLLAGALIGLVGYRMMRRIDHFQTEILITLAMVMGGYAFCHSIHVSGPLAMVVAGIFTGNGLHHGVVSDVTRDYLEKFWEVVDEVLNALLFVLLGLELVVIGLPLLYFGLGLVVALGLVAARWVSLALPIYGLGLRHARAGYAGLPPGALPILTWGGLRGGISLALALALPTAQYARIFVPMTLAVVLFSILVQGLTLGKVIKHFGGARLALVTRAVAGATAPGQASPNRRA